MSWRDECKCYWVDSIAWTCPTAAYLWRSRVAQAFVFEVRGLCFDDACSAALTPEYPSRSTRASPRPNIDRKEKNDRSATRRWNATPRTPSPAKSRGPQQRRSALPCLLD